MLNVQQKSIATGIIFSILTCGIYSFFWLAGIINDICDIKGIKRTGGRDILFSILTCGVYMIYLMYKMGSDLDDIRYSRNLPTGNRGVLYLILSFFGLSLISIALAQSSINDLC